MHNTTSPAIPALEAITSDLLAHVSGGCHKHCCPCPQPAPCPEPQAVQAPAPLLPAPSGPSVSTNVSINGQPAAQA